MVLNDDNELKKVIGFLRWLWLQPHANNYERPGRRRAVWFADLIQKTVAPKT